MPHQRARWFAMTGFESAAGDRKGRPYGVTGGLCVRVVGDADPYGGRQGGNTDCHASLRTGSQ